ncbi:MAG TPA: hypothetical protein ACFYEM_11520, partial [Candidatus Hypogeohydataceae bacterium YC40]
EDLHDYYFVGGYIHYKLDDRKEAVRQYEECLKFGDDPKARRNLRRLQNKSKEGDRTQKFIFAGGWAMTGLSIAGLITLCVFYFLGLERPIYKKAEKTALSQQIQQKEAKKSEDAVNKSENTANKETKETEFIVTPALLEILTPIFLFFMAVGILLPYIKGIKGPAGMGFEKETPTRTEAAPPKLEKP